MVCPECGARLVVCVKKGKVSVFDDNRSEEELAKKRHARLTGYAAKLNKLGKSAISNYENNSRGVSAEMLTQLSRLFHVSADYILNGDSPDNLDPVVNEAIEILNNLKTDKAKQSALEVLRQIQILEG
jgi:transcriptional regulator with XRE-family HTH domain